MIIHWRNFLIAALLLFVIFWLLKGVPRDSISGFSLPPLFLNEHFSGVDQLFWWALLFITIIAIIRMLKK